MVLESYAPGGQAGASSLIENFFGFPTGISGGDLTYRAQLQAFRFGAKFTTPSQVLSLGHTPEAEHPHFLHIEGCNAVLRAKTVIIATGADYRRLDAEGREQFEGSGVYYAATPLEAQLCSGSTAVVAGAGNSAGQAAMFVSEGAQKVLLIVRGDSLTKSMSSYLSRRIETKENIEVLFQTEIRRMNGRKILESIELENTDTGARRTVETPAVFSMTGALPCTAGSPPRSSATRKASSSPEQKWRNPQPGRKWIARPARWKRAVQACLPRATFAPVRSSVARLRWAKAAWRLQMSTALSHRTALVRAGRVMDRPPIISGRRPTVSGSFGAAGTDKLSFTPNPSTTVKIAFALGAVARMTRAPHVPPKSFSQRSGAAAK